MAELGGSKLTNIIKAKEDMTKSPEQLDCEKRDIIKSRIVRLKLDGETREKLERQANNFHELLHDLYDIIYDLNEKHDRQKYDMMELTKRAIQVEKGKSKTRKSNIVHTGLGGSVFPWLTDVSTNAPGKISLFSRYERVTDRRSLAERREIFEHHKEEERQARNQPKIETDTRARREAYENKAEEKHVEQPRRHVEPEPEHHEEEHHEQEEHEEEEEHHEQEEHHQEPEEEEHHEPEEHNEEENHDDDEYHDQE